MAYLLLSGRTIDQAKGMHMGKCSAFYGRAISTVEMSESDMRDEVLEEGDAVRIISEWGETGGWVKKSDIPRGMVFIPMGPAANAVSGTDTEGTGMPLFKGFSVEIRKAENHEPRT